MKNNNLITNEMLDEYDQKMLDEYDYDLNQIIVEDKTIHSEISGIVEFGKDIINGKRVLVVSIDESEIVEYFIPKENENNLISKEGDEIMKGDVLYLQTQHWLFTYEEDEEIRSLTKTNTLNSKD